MEKSYDGIDSNQLLALIEKIERLEEEKKGISTDIAAVYADAKSQGYDPKIMRAVIKQRSMDEDDVEAFDTILDLYKRALGMIGGEDA